MSEWKRVKEFIVHSTKGITPSYVDQSNVLVLNQKCVRNNVIDFTQARYTDDSKNISENKIVKVGDILFNSTGQGTAGRCAFVSQLPNDVTVITDSHMLLLRCNTYEEARCLNYTLYSFEENIQTFMDGSTGQGELDKVKLFNLLVKIPSNELVQQKIASVLSSLDAKIALNNRINAELEAMAKTLYDYWFVQFDFPDENGNPYKSSGGAMEYNAELKREIPKGWKIGNLFDVMNVQYGFPFDTTQFTDDITQKPVVRIRDILENTISLYSTEDVNDKYILNKNDLLIGMDGNFHMNFWDKDGAYLNQRSVRIRSKEDSTISNFQAYFELSPYIKAREKNVSRTTVGHLSDKDLKRLFLIQPKISNHYNPKKTFDSLLEKITSNRLENQQLAELRDWLLPMLMNGQVRVA